MTFHIGQQSGGVVNNVGGDQRITGGQQGTYVSGAVTRAAVRDLRSVLAELGLDAHTRAQAAGELDTVEHEVRAEQPDQPRAASALERLTRLLGQVGAFAKAGTALVTPLKALATWLGPLGATVAGLLPALL